MQFKSLVKFQVRRHWKRNRPPRHVRRFIGSTSSIQLTNPYFRGNCSTYAFLGIQTDCSGSMYYLASWLAVCLGWRIVLVHGKVGLLCFCRDGGHCVRWLLCRVVLHVAAAAGPVFLPACLPTCLPASLSICTTMCVYTGMYVHA